MQAAITASLEHLREWMPWARREPEPVADKARRLARFRRNFVRGRDFNWGMFDPEETRVLGGIGMHRRIGSGAAAIGYWVHVDHVGRGLATEAAAAVLRAGFEHGELGRIEIHCDPANTASAAIPRKLGFTLQVTIPGCVLNPGMAPRDTMIWTMHRRDFPGNPAASR